MTGGGATRQESSREESLGHVGWRRRAARCLRGGGSNPSLFVCGSKKEMGARRGEKGRGKGVLGFRRGSERGSLGACPYPLLFSVDGEGVRQQPRPLVG